MIKEENLPNDNSQLVCTYCSNPIDQDCDDFVATNKESVEESDGDKIYYHLECFEKIKKSRRKEKVKSKENELMGLLILIVGILLVVLLSFEPIRMVVDWMLLNTFSFAGIVVIIIGIIKRESKTALYGVFVLILGILFFIFMSRI